MGLHITLLKYLTEETDTTADDAPPAAEDERASPFTLAALLRVTSPTDQNWTELARKVCASSSTDL